MICKEVGSSPTVREGVFLRGFVRRPPLRSGYCPDHTETQVTSYRRMFAMSSADELNEKLQVLDAEFDREMRARGFDPAQAENVALPSHLATLYAKRVQIRAQLAELEGKTDD